MTGVVAAAAKAEEEGEEAIAQCVGGSSTCDVWMVDGGLFGFVVGWVGGENSNDGTHGQDGWN